MAALKKAEKAEAELALAQEVIATYPRIGPSTPTSFIVFSNNYEKASRNLLNICHASLSRQSAKMYDQIITNFYGYMPLELRFFDYLQNVLFKDYRDRIELCDSGIPITEDSLDRYRKHDKALWEGKNHLYIKVSKLDTIPANVLYDFCIASRVIIEYQGQLLSWGKMVEAGVHPGLAYRLSYSLGYNQRAYYPDIREIQALEGWEQVLDYKVQQIGCGAGHWAFDPGVDVQRLLTGTPDPAKMAKLSWKDHPASSTPCNVIWGAIGRKAEEGLAGKTVREISDMLGLKLADPTVGNADSPCHYMNVVEAQEEAAHRFGDDDDDDDDFPQQQFDGDDDDDDDFEDHEPDRFEDEEEEI